MMPMDAQLEASTEQPARTQMEAHAVVAMVAPMKVPTQPTVVPGIRHQQRNWRRYGWNERRYQWRHG